MRWEAWYLIAWFVGNGLGCVYLVGKPRERLTPGGAVICLILYAFNVWCVLRCVGVIA